MSEPVVRTFDAPEALGIRFHEVHAKSAINAVPERVADAVSLDDQPLSRLYPCVLQSIASPAPRTPTST